VAAAGARRPNLPAEALAVGVLVAAVCAFWWRLLLMRGYLVADDMATQNLPFASLYARALLEGRLPLWTGHLGAGYPLFAEGQIGALYPLNLLLFRFFPPLAAMNLGLVAHVLLATLGAYACARALNLSRSAAMLSGLAFGLSGLMVVHAVHINIVRAASWLPLLILCVDRAAARPRPSWRWAVAIAAVTGMQWLAGHPQTTVLCLAAAVWYAAFAAFACGRAAFWTRARRVWPVVAAGILLGAGLGAAQMLPTLSLASYSGRAALAGGRSAFGIMPAGHLVSLLLPTLVGSPKPNTFPGDIWQFQEWCGYLGAIPLLLAAAAGLRFRQGRAAASGEGGWRIWALASLALAALAWAVSPQIAQAVGHIPLLRGMRVPPRALLVFVMSAGLLAGVALDRARSGDRRAVRLLAGAAAALLVFGAVLLWSRGRLAWIVPGFQGNRSRDLAHYSAQPELWLIAATLAAAALALHLAPRRPRAMTGLVVVLAGVQLFAFGAGYQAVVPAAFYHELPWTAKAVRSRGDIRVFSRHYLREPQYKDFLAERGDWSRDRRLFEADRNALNYDWPAWYDIRALHVYMALPLRPYQRLMRRIAFEPPPDDAPLWGATGAGAIVASRYFGPERRPTRIAWVPYAPRVRLVGALRANGVDEAVEMLLRRADPRRETVIVAPADVVLPRAAGGEARIAQDDPLRVTVEAASAGPAVLALADAAAPGWHAEVNGREAPIWVADGMFRGVAVPAGESQVVFEYRPTSVRVGLFAGLLAAALLCGIAACWAIRSRGEDRPDAPAK